MTVLVKICGITREHDALAAVESGAQALGFVFHPGSPRHVTAAHAARIIREVPPFVCAVGLFVDADAADVERVIAKAPLNLLQFHGREVAVHCDSFARPYIKAARVKKGLDLLQYAQSYPAARGLLLDAYVEGTHGGTGTAFDWALIPRELPLPVVLSGGLTPLNVGDAVRRVRPAAVDVSSGVESAPGVKDERKIAAFMSEVRNADV